MTASSCPFKAPGPAVALGSPGPVVLDSAALLPGIVGTAAARPCAFHLAARSLLRALTESDGAPSDRADRLRALADVASASAHRYCHVVPDAVASRAASQDASGMRPAEIAERVRYDDFFAVRRVGALDAETLAGTTFRILAAVFADLARGAQVGFHELVALLRGATESTRWIEHREMGPVREEAVSPTPAPVERFVLGHHVFALMCGFAAHHVRVVRADPMSPSADVELLRAAWFVRATTAAMWFSVSFPPATYREDIRPEMDAASSEEHGFSGGDNFDFRRLREQWEDLHRLLVVSWEGLPEPTREAAIRLFQTVVLDNEQHTALAAEMVGLLPSLNAERHARRQGVRALSAVGALRMNTDDRRWMLDQLVNRRPPPPVPEPAEATR